MPYQFAAGYNGTASLTDISIQPRSFGIVDGRRTITGEGLVITDGFSNGGLQYGYLTKAQYGTITAEFGLNSGTTSVKATISLPTNEDRDTFANYNAVIVKPDVGNEASFEFGTLQDVTFQLLRLEAL
jgi:hypothetical protein